MFPFFVTVYFFNGVDAGPLRTDPSIENKDPWQGHGRLLFDEL